MSIKNIFGKIKNKLQLLFQKNEEKVLFPFSHIFWHFITSLAVIATVVGIGIVLWSLSPTLKKGVDEPDYIKEHVISASDIQECAKNMKPQPKKTVTVKKKVKKVNPQTKNTEIVEEEVVQEVAPPMISLAKLMEALPGTRFTQKGRRMICDYSEGYYEYGDWGDWVYPSRCYEYGDVDTKNATEIRNKMQSYYPYDSLNQQNTVNALASHLMRYSTEQRTKIYAMSLKWMDKTKNLSELFEIWTTVDKVIGGTGEFAVKTFGEFFDFMANNATNGKTVLTKALEVVTLANGSDQYSIFRIMRKSYKAVYELNVQEWSTSIDKFLSMKELLKADDLVYNLTCYYDLIQEERENRVVENRRMKAQYEHELEAAENDMLYRKAEKRGLTALGGIVAGISVGVILLVVMILVLLSMQRTLARMEQKLSEKQEK